MSDAVINRMKRSIVKAASQAGEGHIPSALSILDLVWVLHDRCMRRSPTSGLPNTDDRFVLSKGHGSLALYAVLAEKSYFPATELEYFCHYDSMLGGHPDCNKVPGVEASTGSLGHGLPMAIGMALAARIQKTGQQIYCLIGDGEANEGTIWEAALLARQHRLDSLTCLVDFNHSTDRALDLGDLGAKFRSFGWSVAEVDGHDHVAIENALKLRTPGHPLALIAQTTKGKGIPFMEGNPAWHHRAPNAAELQQMLEVLA